MKRTTRCVLFAVVVLLETVCVFSQNIPIFGASNVQGVQNKPSTQTTNEDVDLETEEEFIAKVIESDAAYQKLKQSRIGKELQIFT
jgi:hypothetical protein